MNSSIASGGGRTTKPVLKVSLFAAPSSRKLFDWLRTPLTLKPAVTAPKPWIAASASPRAPPSRAGGSTTPGIRVPNCVKLRPLSGNWTIFTSSTTMPSVAFEVSIRGASPVTVIVSENSPTASVMLIRAVSAALTRTPSRESWTKPSSAAVTL